MSKIKNLSTYLILSLLSVIFIIPIAASAATPKATTNKSSATPTESGSTTQAVTQGYGTDTPLQNGMIVKLQDKVATKVEPLTQATAPKMDGVVVAANDAAVTLSNNGNAGQVFVAKFGHFDVLVSNQNGPIKTGDYITISALAGVGMKVDTVQPTVLGRATANFDGTGNVAGTATIKDSTGKDVKLSLGRIPVDISVSFNPLQQSADKNLPGFLKNISSSIAQKPVSTARVYLGLVVLVVSAFVAGGMLYSGVRGGLIAIGRNPLAKKQIIGGIIRVILSGLIVFIMGLFGVYLLLKL